MSEDKVEAESETNRSPRDCSSFLQPGCREDGSFTCDGGTSAFGVETFVIGQIKSLTYAPNCLFILRSFRGLLDSPEFEPYQPVFLLLVHQAGKDNSQDTSAHSGAPLSDFFFFSLLTPVDVCSCNLAVVCIGTHQDSPFQR